MTVYFTSDLHIGHLRINELAGRPFSSVEEMNETIIERWNSVVRPMEDTVFVLGDIIMGNFKQNIELIRQLNGLKYMIPGNHDRIFGGTEGPYGKRYLEFLRAYQEVGFVVFFINKTKPAIKFSEAIKPFKLNADEQDFYMSHFPYTGDSHDEDRYSEYRPPFDPKTPWLIHGHVHEKWKVNGHQINVGVDVWDFTPVSENVIRNIMEVSN